MNITFRARADLLHRIRVDLMRPHAFAHERVGFITCRPGRLDKDGLVIVAAGYAPIADEDYVDIPRLDDLEVGATMGPTAIRKALQIAYNQGAGDLCMFHVHMHDHLGMPGFGRLDDQENRRFVPDFFNIAPRVPHGAVVLSRDMAFGMCWPSRGTEPIVINRFAVTGAPFRLWWRK